MQQTLSTIIDKDTGSLCHMILVSWNQNQSDSDFSSIGLAMRENLLLHDLVLPWFEIGFFFGSCHIQSLSLRPEILVNQNRSVEKSFTLSDRSMIQPLISSIFIFNIFISPFHLTNPSPIAFFQRKIDKENNFHFGQPKTPSAMMPAAVWTHFQCNAKISPFIGVGFGCYCPGSWCSNNAQCCSQMCYKRTCYWVRSIKVQFVEISSIVCRSDRNESTPFSFDVRSFFFSTFHFFLPEALLDFLYLEYSIFESNQISNCDNLRRENSFHS